MSKAARRDVRRAAALADELNIHSFALHGIVWTLRYPEITQMRKMQAFLPNLS